MFPFQSGVKKGGCGAALPAVRRVARGGSRRGAGRRCTAPPSLAVTHMSPCLLAFLTQHKQSLLVLHFTLSQVTPFPHGF
jgi:hypothetical protein